MKKLLVLMMLVSACGGGEKKEKQLEYVPGETPTAGVFLRLVTLDEQSLTLEVVGKDIEGLYGLAFRLGYNPEVLDFAEMTPAAAWPANAISIARQNSTGILVAAVTSRGDFPGLDFSDQVLATLRFTLLQEAETRVNFITEKCALVNTEESRLSDHSWSGGNLELR